MSHFQSVIFRSPVLSSVHAPSQALFLVMWPLSWYQFCVSLPLEVRTVGLVLFLQVLTLLSVLHCCRQPVMLTLCSVTALSVQPCVATRRYARHDLLSLETAATPPPFLSPQLITRLSHLGLARNVPSNESTPIEKRRRGGKNERRKIKVIVGGHRRSWLAAC